METFFFNTGTSATYNPKTGDYSNFGNGLYEYRVGDEVENVKTGQRFFIHNFGSPYIVWVNPHQNCLVMMLKPVLEARKHFGFVLVTKMQVDGKPCGLCSRYTTRIEAETEVSRLLGINFHGEVKILDKEP